MTAHGKLAKMDMNFATNTYPLMVQLYDIAVTKL